MRPYASGVAWPHSLPPFISKASFIESSCAFWLFMSQRAAVASSLPVGLLFGNRAQCSRRAQSGLAKTNTDAFAAPRAIASTMAGSLSIVLASVVSVKSG